MKRLFAAALVIGALIMGTVGSAFADGTVVVYNATNPKLAAKIIDAFKQKNPGIDVEVINAGVGELFTRIAAEKERPRGDVLLGASVEAYDSALELFAPYVSKEDRNFDRDVVAEGKQYYGFSMPLQAFIVNQKLLPGQTGPQSWEDLGKPEFK
ncbi:MAG: extracellular solute-binding protein, partial [Rhodospirillales bacterium]|nr:extracellular solute-binding protein [Rhodospirillales bacterium]